METVLRNMLQHHKQLLDLYMQCKSENYIIQFEDVDDRIKQEVLAIENITNALLLLKQ